MISSKREGVGVETIMPDELLSPAVKHPDILLLHGLSKSLVTFLVSLFDGLGLGASSVLDLPSLSLPQQDKVDLYIEKARFIIVLATFDEESDTTKRARPNVYDELARCIKVRPQDFLVLREQRGGIDVELPSNVMGRVVIIPFRQERLRDMIPPLLKELRSRHLLTVTRELTQSERILKDFIARMDYIWEHEFDDAWEKIHQSDYEAESQVAIALDKFFQQYHYVFSQAVRQHLAGEALVSTCNTAYASGLKEAEYAWDVVVKTILTRATNLTKDFKGSQQKAKAVEAGVNKASAAYRRGQRVHNPEEAIKQFRMALQLLESQLEEFEDV
jgi:hypothetical protein